MAGNLEFHLRWGGWTISDSMMAASLAGSPLSFT